MVAVGRVPGVGRVGIGGAVVDVVVVVAGAPVVVVVATDEAVVVVVVPSDVEEVKVDVTGAAVATGAAVVGGATESEPPPQAEATTAMVRKIAMARIDRVWHVPSRRPHPAPIEEWPTYLAGAGQSKMVYSL